MKGYVIAGLVLGILLLCGVFPWVGILVGMLSVLFVCMAFR
jgi:hypothetical protein